MCYCNPSIRTPRCNNIDCIPKEPYEELLTIGTGQLLFHNKDAAIALIAKINKQIDLCENDDESKCFRIDWQILYGSKTK